MRNLLIVIAAVFLLLVVSYQALSFLGETAEEVFIPLEWAKDLAGFVLAVAVLFFLFTGRDGRTTAERQ
jgi:hypothetical protein